MFPTLLVLLLAISFLFVGCLLGATIGALSGWVVGLAFDGSLDLLAKALGIPEAHPYQLGAMMGFVGSFFRSTFSDGKKD